jgi:hypothetical protein
MTLIAGFQKMETPAKAIGNPAVRNLATILTAIHLARGGKVGLPGTVLDAGTP